MLDPRLNWKKISKNKDVLALIESMLKTQEKIRKLDEGALLRYQLEFINLPTEN